MRHDRWVNQWTDERVAKLRELWPDPDMSALRIADAIGGGLSRSAVIGKAHRLGLSKTKRAVKVKHVPPKPRRPRVVRNFGGVWGAYPDKTPEPLTPRRAALPSLGLTIIEAGPFQCRYIEGDDRLCCGHPVKPGTSWCPEHYAIVYPPKVERSEKQKAHDVKLGQRTARRATETTEWMAEEAA